MTSSSPLSLTAGLVSSGERGHRGIPKATQLHSGSLLKWTASSFVAADSVKAYI